MQWWGCDGLNGQRPDADGDYLKQLVLQRCCDMIVGFMVVRQQAAVALLWQALWQKAMADVHGLCDYI